MEIKVLDTVVLTRDFTEHGLRAGDLGAVVEVLTWNELMVEFVTGDGRTQALVTLSPNDTRPVGPDDMPSVRKLDAA